MPSPVQRFMLNWQGGATGDAYHIKLPPQKEGAARYAGGFEGCRPVIRCGLYHAHGLPPSTMTSSKQWL